MSFRADAVDFDCDESVLALNVDLHDLRMFLMKIMYVCNNY
jgi:hypothetical protein